MEVKTFILVLTPEEVRAVRFIGDRYCWTSILLDNVDPDTGDVELKEHQMWEFHMDVERDAEGGHDTFPMAGDDLKKKLSDFLDMVE